MDNKHLLIDTINAMETEQANTFLKVINGFMAGNLKQVCESLDIDLGNVDFARPQSWSDKMKDLGVNTQGFVWSYKDNCFGQPVNLFSEVFKAMHEFFNEI